jgi:hypothetical protein
MVPVGISPALADAPSEWFAAAELLMMDLDENWKTVKM